MYTASLTNVDHDGKRSCFINLRFINKVLNLRNSSSEIHVHGLEDHVATQWAVVLVDGLAQQDVGTVSA